MRRAGMLAAILLLAALVLVGCAPNAPLAATTTRDVSPSDGAGTGGAPQVFDEDITVSLYERAIPAVVEVRTVVENGSHFGFGGPEGRGQGSGFLVDGEGHILTNNHVVQDAIEVKVVLHDGSVLDAKVLGTDRESDLALLSVDPEQLGDIRPLPLGDSDEVRPGQMAIALGSPFGLEGSITVGVISAVGRSMPSMARRPITNMLQTDAAINPGNSGGPLLNSSGEVIGINTAIEPSGTGIGFAIPINRARSLLPELLKGGEVSNAWLGIQGIAVDEELASSLDLPVTSGVYVVAVIEDSPAEKAGLRESGTDEQGRPTFGGDVIVAVDGTAVASVEDLVDYFNGKRPGDRVSLSVRRGTQSLTLDVTLEEWPEEMP